MYFAPLAVKVNLWGDMAYRQNPWEILTTNCHSLLLIIHIVTIFLLSITSVNFLFSLFFFLFFFTNLPLYTINRFRLPLFYSCTLVSKIPPLVSHLCSHSFAAVERRGTFSHSRLSRTYICSLCTSLLVYLEIPQLIM